MAGARALSPYHKAEKTNTLAVVACRLVSFMLKRIALVAVILAVFILMIWFTSINPGNMTIDLAFLTVQPTIPLALAVTFVLGWLFGILCASGYVLKLLNERRRLRTSVQSMETEVSSLRNLPIADAD